MVIDKVVDAGAMNIVLLDNNKESSCRTILNALPQWFGIEEARERYARQAQDLPMIACIDQNSVVGFLTLKCQSDHAAEIHCMGILPRWHRFGIGTKLILHAKEFAQQRGIQFLTVKTLSPRKTDPFYESTRQFYRAVGFVELEEFPDLWGPDNPCLLMVMHITEQATETNENGDL